MVSSHADLAGPVHYLEFGGEGPPLVCVHGLGGSALNWMAVRSGLAARHRVLAPDLRGFGRTPLGRGSRLADNQLLLDRFLREVAGTPATVVANSMGCVLAVRQAARHPETVARLVLVDPALPQRGRRPFDVAVIGLFAALLTPFLSEALMARRARRRGPELVVAGVLDLCCVDPGRVAADVVRAHVDLERERLRTLRSQRALAQAARSLLWALGEPGHLGLYREVRAPALILHGERDRLVPVDFPLALGRSLGWPVEVMPDVGHVPMLEAPDEFLRLALGWLDSQQPAAA